MHYIRHFKQDRATKTLCGMEIPSNAIPYSKIPDHSQWGDCYDCVKSALTTFGKIEYMFIPLKEKQCTTLFAEPTDMR
jgi:hypothetical protein